MERRQKALQPNEMILIRFSEAKNTQTALNTNNTRSRMHTQNNREKILKVNLGGNLNISGKKASQADL